MKASWLEFYARHRYRIWGVGLAIIAGILILTINFWRTLLIAALIFVGYMIGRTLDGQGDMKARILNILDRILPKG